MNNKLVLAVLLVTLSWLSNGTYAQNTTTAMTATTGTMETTATTEMATTGATNATEMTTTGTTGTTEMTTTEMTTTEMTTTEMTTTGTTNATEMTTTGTTEMTTTEMTTTGTTNATEMTTTGPTSTTEMTTTGTTNATEMTTTTAPPLVPNTTVSELQRNISRLGCGTRKLCAAEPAECSPGPGCVFLSVKQMSGQNFMMELSGESDGYVAVTVTIDGSVGGNDETYICANNNSVVQFFSAILLNNGSLNLTEVNVNSVQGRVNGNVIQCTFNVTIPSQRLRVSNVILAVSNGTFNSTSGALGSPNTQLQSGQINLADPTTNVTNVLMANTTTMAPTTMAPTTTCGAITHQLSLTHALLITVGVLTMTRL